MRYGKPIRFVLILFGVVFALKALDVVLMVGMGGNPDLGTAYVYSFAVGGILLLLNYIPDESPAPKEA